MKIALFRGVTMTQNEERLKVLLALRRTCLLQHVGEDDLVGLANEAERLEFRAGEQLGSGQGEPQQAMFVVTEGYVCRERWSDGRRIRKVNEGPEGMGDAWAFTVSAEIVMFDHSMARIFRNTGERESFGRAPSANYCSRS